jgi:hypothetical protein
MGYNTIDLKPVDVRPSSVKSNFTTKFQAEKIKNTIIDTSK